MRGKIGIVLHCAKHGTELDINADGELHSSEKKNRKNIISASSAYEVNPHIYINPCSACVQEYDKLINSIDIIQKAKENN